MSKLGRIGKEFILEIEDEIYKKSDIQEMSLNELHMLCGFCEKESHLRFIQNNTEIESIQVYIDSLLFKIQS
jgi:hypothetical protein